MHRLRHSAISFAIVLVVYWLYALIVVPFIEPTIDDHSYVSANTNRLEPADDQRVKQLKVLFSPGNWELDNPKILENDRVILFLKDYVNTPGDNQMKLNKCTIVFLWDGPAENEAQRLRQSVILKAAQGAILKFDKPMELTRMGRLVGGQLLGPITISSQGKSPGPEDDLLIRTSDVQLTETEVSTPNPLTFTWGKTFGSGRDMHIKLKNDPTKTGNGISSTTINGIELFEIRHIDQLHLESAPTALASTGSTPPASNPTGGLTPNATDQDLPIEITCRGPFAFNVVKSVATFSDHVDVLRLNPNGPSDQIQCEQLSIFFAPRDKSKPDSDSMSNLEPERLEARGFPVDINAPKENITGRGERLEYNLKTKVIALEGGPEVSLCQGPNEIHAKKLRYQSLGPNRLGYADAQGPGRLKGQMKDKPDQRLEASWNDKLQLLPQEKNYVISFTGGAALDYAGIGHLEAKEIFFWLKEGPIKDPLGQPNMLPDQMMARNNVILNSDKLSAAVDRLEVSFEQSNLPQNIRTRTENSGNTMQGQGSQATPTINRFTQSGTNILQTGWQPDPRTRTTYRLPLNAPEANANYLAAAPQQFQQTRQTPFRQPAPSQTTGRTQPAPLYPRYLPPLPPAQPSNQNQTIPTPNGFDPAQNASAAGNAPQQHIKVSGRVLQACIRLREREEASLSEITITDNVRLEETQTISPNELPLLIQGDRLHGTNVSSPTAVVNVTGKTAHFEGRGLGLTGSNINLDRGANRLWIDGPGRMDLPMNGSMVGESLVPGQQINMTGTLVIEWKKKMLFDGSSAKYEEAVSATTPQMQLQTDFLEVQLKRPINFSDRNLQNPSQDKPEAEKLLCQGGVYLETHNLENPAQTPSYIRMKVADLAVNIKSGALSAGGPGWVNIVTLMSDDQMQNQLGPNFLVGRPTVAPPSNGAANPAQSGNQLICFHVRFQGSITGNIHQGEMTFNEQVRAVYAPVLDWSAVLDPDNRESLGPKGIIMNCNHLKFNQMPMPVGKKQNIEVEALENAVVEGSLMQKGNFTARAQRISYSKAKDQLILVGDGYTEAELFRQLQPGAETSRFAAQKFLYNIRTNALDVNGARFVEINLNK